MNISMRNISGDAEYLEAANNGSALHHNSLSSIPNKCEAEGCSAFPTFGMKDDKKRRWCRLHIQEGSVYIYPRITCEYMGCPKQPNYGMPEEKKRRWCKEHGPVGSIYVSGRKLCEAEVCGRHPNYGLKGESTRRWCKTHAPTEAVYMATRKLCEGESCSKQPNFGLPEQGKRRWCKAHSPRGAINFAARKRQRSSDILEKYCKSVAVLERREGDEQSELLSAPQPALSRLSSSLLTSVQPSVNNTNGALSNVLQTRIHPSSAQQQPTQQNAQSTSHYHLHPHQHSLPFLPSMFSPQSSQQNISHISPGIPQQHHWSSTSGTPIFHYVSSSHHLQ